MTCEESIKWLNSLIKTLGQSQYQSLWNWEQPLTEIKGMLESKRVIELPCKVGDTVYVVPSLCNFRLNIVNRYPENNRICEQKVHSLQMWNANEYCLWTCDGINLLLQKFYKETWFFTREEAEEKMKELKENA